MGIKKIFKKKEPTEEEIKAQLEKSNITVKSSNGREEKFGAFRQYAHEKQQQKPQLKPVNPYSNVQSNSNPYANGGVAPAANPYASGQTQGSTSDISTSNSGNPYASQSGRPYGNSSQVQDGNRSYKSNNPYGGASNASRSDPYALNNPKSSNSSPYGNPSSNKNAYSSATRGAGGSSNPYAYAKPKSSSASVMGDTDSLDLNRVSSNLPQKSVYKPNYAPSENLDLNEVAEDEDDLNLELEDLPQEEEVNSEDEEVEAIKQDIRFTKQQSIESTRNTLRMAQDADVSAVNTMGLLGSQSERLYNAEQNLLLADTQTKIAKDKVEQLRRLNRSIFIPANSMNPFNKKARLRAQEQQLLTEKAQEKYLRETNRKGVYESEQRLKEGITNNATSSELHNKYKGEANLEAARRFQFENDSEDDEMEKELASNLDQIALFSKKLKNNANIMSQEVDSQNNRLKKIEEDADRLDINVHLNSSRLQNIR